MGGKGSGRKRKLASQEEKLSPPPHPPAAASGAAGEGDDGENGGEGVSFLLSGVHQRFVCSLCSGYYREPYTLTECLHTFCKSCLFYAVSSGCHECPECHTFIGRDGATKFARPDVALQGLVDSVLFPGLAEVEDREAAEFYRRRGVPLKDAAAETATGGGGVGERGIARARGDSSSTTTRRSDNKKRRDDDTIEFALFPSPSDRRNKTSIRPLERPFLRVSGRIKMEQLKRYVIQSLGQDGTPGEASSSMHKGLEMLCNGVPVGNEMSLGFVDRLLWPHASTLELTYAEKGTAYR